MKTTREKIKMMVAFLDGETIRCTNKRNHQEGFNNIKSSGDNMWWDWSTYDYEIYKEPTYKTGQRFKKVGGGEYILAQVDACECCLISLTEGNRWDRPMHVCNTSQITKEEFLKMGGDSFTLIE